MPWTTNTLYCTSLANTTTLTRPSDADLSPRSLIVVINDRNRAKIFENNCSSQTIHHYCKFVNEPHEALNITHNPFSVFRVTGALNFKIN